MKLQTLKPRLKNVIKPRIKMADPPSQANSYRIRGRALIKIRQEYFKRNPLCVHCIDAGHVTPAVELDHVIPLAEGGADTDENRQGLCLECHADKTKEDLARIAKSKGWGGCNP